MVVKKQQDSIMLNLKKKRKKNCVEKKEINKGQRFITWLEEWVSILYVVT